MNAGDTDLPDLIAIASIARPQGIRGEVIAELLTDFPDRFANLSSVRVGKSVEKAAPLKIENYRFHKGRVVLKFEGIDSIDLADTLRGARVMITRDELVKLPEDTYYDFDLIGCEVLSTGGAPVGRVTDVNHFGAAPLLVVKDDSGREHLIPLVLSICVEIDIGRKRIVIDPPDGLMELN